MNAAITCAARPFKDLDDLNTQFLQWRDTIAHQRRHPDQRPQTVVAVLAEEQRVLLPRCRGSRGAAGRAR